MAGFTDNAGQDVVRRTTCQCCGAQTIQKQIGYNNMDAAIANRHSLLDQFEPMPDGWVVNHDVGGWICAECKEELSRIVQSFKARKLETQLQH